MNSTLAQLQSLQADQFAQAAFFCECFGNAGLAAAYYRQAAAAWSACASEFGPNVPDSVTGALAYCQARVAFLEATQTVNQVLDAVKAGQEIVQCLSSLFGGGFGSW